MDFELEMGFFVGARQRRWASPCRWTRPTEHIFGLVLVNDWSARDIQKWEYQPLGPFNAKNFATSISPWVVTLDALAPFRCAAPGQDREPLAYLRETDRRTYDINLEVHDHGRGPGRGPARLPSNFKHLYWTMAQQLAHHTSTGCNLSTGDLLASRHHQRAGQGQLRLHAGDHLAGHRTDHPARRRASGSSWPTATP